jgi:hypothetical protein
MKRSLQSTLFLLLFIVVLLLAPLLLPEFYVTLLNYIGLYAIVALGLVMLTGVGGLTSFGQAAFAGLGAYTSAYLTTVHGVSPWLTLPAGLLVTAWWRSRWDSSPAPVRPFPAAGHHCLGDEPLLSVRQSRGARRPHRHQRHPAAADRRAGTPLRPRVLLPDLGGPAAARAGDAQPARFARRPRHPGAEGWLGDGRSDGGQHGRAQDRRVYRRRPLRQAPRAGSMRTCSASSIRRRSR